MKLLITCPPMLGTKNHFLPSLKEKGIDVYCPEVVQTLSEAELIDLVPKFDAWIIGDDPATREVFKAGRNGKLKAAVKWGIGVDNVDFGACKVFNISITNTPDMFGAEVADMAVCYLTGLARNTYFNDREIRAGRWPKLCGLSLSGKTVGLIGFGDIGKSTATRLQAADIDVIVYDPVYTNADMHAISPASLASWPDRISECDFLIFTCSLNENNRHMLNKEVLSKCKHGVRIINVARGPLNDEDALINALNKKQVHSVALDVFEKEPIDSRSPLIDFPYCIFGSHNSSNTIDAVQKTNTRAINELFKLLGSNEFVK